MEATQRVLAERGPDAMASHVIEAAGVGRNTFYAHFRNLDEAIDEAADDAAFRIDEEVRAVLAGARTPIEKIRLLARAWLASIDASQSRARVLLTRASRGEGLSPGGTLFQRLLAAVLVDARQAAAISAPHDEARVRAISAAVELVSYEHACGKHLDPELIADMIVRAFR